MKFDNALNLQCDVFRSIFGFAELSVARAESEETSMPVLVDPEALSGAVTITAVSKRERAVASSIWGRRRRPIDEIALGIGSKTDGDDHELLVLVQNRRLLRCEVVDRIIEKSRNEARPIYIGRQTAAAAWTTARGDPIRLGCSISPATGRSAGTLGCFARDQQDNSIGILSNNHLLASLNRLPRGTEIVQQGRSDGGKPARDVIAELVRFVPLQFGGIPNHVDAAFAKLKKHGRKEDRHTVFDSRSKPAPVVTLKPNVVVPAKPGMAVMKTGRTTRHTKGIVLGVNVNNLRVKIGDAEARFDRQIAIGVMDDPPRPFSRPGDSGAVIVDGEGRLVGLLCSSSMVGGPGDVGVTIANPMKTVLSQLGIAIV